jgi:hypothetical protein
MTIDTHDELRIKVVPMLSGNERRGRVLIDLTSLLEVCDGPEEEDRAVQSISTEIDKVPHITQIRANACAEYLLSFLPDKAKHVNHNKKFERRRWNTSLALQSLVHCRFHVIRSEKQHGLDFRTLAHEYQDNC